MGRGIPWGDGNIMYSGYDGGYKTMCLLKFTELYTKNCTMQCAHLIKVSLFLTENFTVYKIYLDAKKKEQ